MMMQNKINNNNLANKLVNFLPPFNFSKFNLKPRNPATIYESLLIVSIFNKIWSNLSN